jgi:hypothetical protein
MIVSIQRIGAAGYVIPVQIRGMFSSYTMWHNMSSFYLAGEISAT